MLLFHSLVTGEAVFRRKIEPIPAYRHRLNPLQDSFTVVPVPVDGVVAVFNGAHHRQSLAGLRALGPDVLKCLFERHQFRRRVGGEHYQASTSLWDSKLTRVHLEALDSVPHRAQLA